MYRVVILCLLAQVLPSHQGCHHNWRHGDRSTRHWKDGEFHELSWEIVNIDRKVHRMCTESNHITETFENSFYRLTVSLPDYAQEDITVKIKHRVILVQALKVGVKVFSEIKVLPEQVKTDDAAWSFKDGQLTIDFMYRVPLGTQVTKNCEVAINTTIKEIPKALAIDARFGADDDGSLNENAL